MIGMLNRSSLAIIQMIDREAPLAPFWVSANAGPLSGCESRCALHCKRLPFENESATH